MKQIGFLEKIATLFEFKTVNDKYGNEFVLFANNTIMILILWKIKQLLNLQRIIFILSIT